jgi:glycine dehydrogenase subunit 1
VPYIPHTDQDLLEMLHDLGPEYLDKLRALIPEELRLKRELDIPEGTSEQELKALLREIGEANATTADYTSFLGAGAYNHYSPSIVAHLAGRSEFYTSYTPYQPEISQGTLQAIFEYQTLVCRLTAMDVSNASLYDGATASAEAVLMARRLRGQKKIYLSSALHPEYRETIKTYLSATPADVVELPVSPITGETDHTLLASSPKGEAACLVMQSPNFLGVIEDTVAFSDIIHGKGGLSIVVVNEPLSMAILKPPGECGADVAVGDLQGFGLPLGFGGPHLGFMAVKDEFVRQMPGRVVGQTVDRDGKRAYCLTLATREQHIRRDKATSNICTNQGLMALSAAIYMASIGREGLRNLAVLNLSKARYIVGELTTKAPWLKLAFTSQYFNEFTITLNAEHKASKGKDTGVMLDALLKEKIIGGLALKRFYPALDRHILICVTELNTKAEMDRLVEILARS